MAGLPKAGVQLVAEGSDAFLGAMKSGEQAVNSFVGATDKAGGGISAFGSIATGALEHVGRLAVDVMGQAAKAVAGFVADSVSSAGDFQANMNVFGSVTGDALAESGKSLEDFSQLFMKLGAELPVSTAEVQQAAIELAKGGIDPATIAAGGLRTALDLAAAGGVGLADSATIMAKQLGVWVASTADAGTKAAFLAQTADLLSQSANATTSDVSELAIGLANAGGTAKIAGLNFRETVTGLSLLAPGFSSASDAGTSFKTFLSRLIPTTKPAISAMIDLGLATEDGKSKFYDAQGSFIGLGAAAELLQQKTAGLSEAQKLQAFQTIFGSDAIRAAAILAEQGAEGYDRMTASLAAAGTVQDQAKARQQGFNTALDNAKGSLESLQITIGSALLPILTTLLNTYIAPGINTLTTFANAVLGSNDAFAELSPTLQTAATTFQYLGQVAGEAFASFQTDGLGAGISTFAAGLETLSPALATAVGMLAPFGDLLQANIIPALAGVGIVITGGVVVAFGALVASALPVIATIGAVAAVGAVLVAAWQADFGGIQGIVSAALSGVVSVVSSVLATIQGFWSTYGGAIVATATETWNSIVTTVGAVMQGLLAVVQPVLANVAAFWATNGADIQATVATVWGQINGIIQTSMALIQATVVPVLSAIAGFISSHSAEIQTVLTNSWTIIKTVITGTLSLIQGLIQTTLQAIQGDWAGAWSTLTSTSATFVQNILTVITTSLSTLATVFTVQFEAAKNAVAGMIGGFTSVGGNIVRGMIDGIKAQAGALAAQAAQVARDALNAAKSALGIQSPSKAFADEVGMPAVQGISVGMTRALPELEDTASAMALAALKAGKGALGISGNTSTEGADVGTTFGIGIGDGLASTLTYIQGMARHISKSLTEDLKKAATEMVKAFQKVLIDGLQANVGFSGTALGNFRGINAITDDSGLEDASQAQQDAQAKLDAAKQQGIANAADLQTKVDGLNAERAKKIADLQARNAAGEYNRKYDISQVQQDASLTEEERIKKIATINKQYDDQRLANLDAIGTLNAEYGQKILDAEAAYDRQNTALQTQLADLQKALDLAKARVLTEQQLDQTKRDIQARARDELAQAEKAANAMRAADPKAADDYYKLRSQQILALANLEKDQAEALAAYQQSGRQDDLERVQNLATEQALLKANQAAEQALFAVQSKGDSPYKDLATQLTTLQTKLADELKRDQGFYNLTDKNNHEMRNKVQNEITADQAALQQVADLLSQLGTQTIDGATAGVAQGSDAFIAQMLAALQGAQQAAQDAMGIHSPSKVMAKAVGLPIMQGIGQGLVAGQKALNQTMTNALASAMPSVSPSMVSPVASASQLANSYSYNTSNTGVSIGNLNAPGGLSKGQVVALWNQLYAAQGRNAYSRRVMR